ncbi:MAG: hypothetical protein ACPHCI_05765 [Solirubrobacterales bacterium]
MNFEVASSAWIELPPAHVGHWLANLLYLAPVLVLAGGIAYQRMADRKARAAAGESARPHDADSANTD